MRHALIVNDDRRIGWGGCHHEVEDAEEFAGIATAIAQQGLVLAHLNLAVAQDDVLVKGAVEQRQQVVAVKALQYINCTAREERTDDFEGRVLGGGADERNDARLHSREEGVLLRLGEAVDFIDEENRALRTEEGVGLGSLYDIAHILHTTIHG